MAPMGAQSAPSQTESGAADGAPVNSTKSKTPTHFRFLDLPAELRNRIYEFTAATSLNSTIMVFYQPPNTRLISTESSINHFHARCELHDKRRRKGVQERFALLATNRQIYREAQNAFYSRMKLKFAGPAQLFSLIGMLDLLAAFRHRLHSIRHLELGEGHALPLLFNNAKTFHEMLATSSGVVKLMQRVMLQIRTHLFSLRSVTVLAGKITVAAGPRMILRLASANNRDTVQRLFPHLHDLRTRSRHGCERFKKRQDGSWEMWYSGERIPLKTHDADKIYSGRGSVHPTTWLSNAMTRDCIGPRVEEEKGKAGSTKG